MEKKRRMGSGVIPAFSEQFSSLILILTIVLPNHWNHEKTESSHASTLDKADASDEARFVRSLYTEDTVELQNRDAEFLA